MDKPSLTFCIKTACAEKDVAAEISVLLEKTGLPHFSRVHILQAMLVEEQQEAYRELANDAENTLNALRDHYESKIDDLEEKAELEKQELINAFEGVCDGNTEN